MTENEKASVTAIPKTNLLRVRLPGFIRDEEIGLGDIVKRVTYASRNPPVQRLREARRHPESAGGFHPLSRCDRSY